MGWCHSGTFLSPGFLFCHGLALGPSDSSLGTGDHGGHSAAHWSLQCSELWRQQGVRSRLWQCHSTGEAQWGEDGLGTVEGEWKREGLGSGNRWGSGARLWAIRLLGRCIRGFFLQILAGYDIALVQEVRDPDLSAVSLLMEQINRCGRAGHHNPSQDYKLGSVP